MSTEDQQYRRTIRYSEGRDSVFTEAAACLSEALDRELKFVGNQSGHWKKELVSILIERA